MRLLSAFANLWRGFVSIFIGDLAMANPRATYEGIIQKRKTRLRELTDLAGSMLARRNKLRTELAACEEAFKRNTRELQAAIATKNKAVGPLLTQQKTQLEARRERLQADLTKAEADAQRVKLDLERAQRDVIALKQEMTENIAKLRSAQLRRELQDLRDGLSTEGDSQSLEALREGIDRQVGAADLRDELADTDVEHQLEAVRGVADKVAGEADFDALLAEHERRQGVAATVTVKAGDDTSSEGGKQV